MSLLERAVSVTISLVSIYIGYLFLISSSISMDTRAITLVTFGMLGWLLLVGDLVDLYKVVVAKLENRQSIHLQNCDNCKHFSTGKQPDGLLWNHCEYNFQCTVCYYNNFEPKQNNREKS